MNIEIYIGIIYCILHIVGGVHVYGYVMFILTKESAKLPFDTWYKDRWTALTLAIFVPIPVTLFYEIKRPFEELNYIFKFFKPRKDNIQNQTCDDTYLFNIWTHPQSNIALEVKYRWEKTHGDIKFTTLH